MKTEKPDFDMRMHLFVKFIIKMIEIALCTKYWKNKSQMESILVKIAKIALLAQKSLFEPKSIFGLHPISLSFSLKSSHEDTVDGPQHFPVEGAH